ncbi:MAG: 4Fe-4S binding protein [Burkholderiales bacterium]|nr:4Fe-4S binding protein [Burkholderiales bacterium]
MRRHRRIIVSVQWTVALVYGILIVVPALLPLPPRGAAILTNLTLFAQFVFWGIWWPGVIASMLLFGRAWCGLFCPEGALSEFASRHGLQKRIPRMIRWPGWPFVAFVLTTVYGQLISVYEYPKAALLILGGSTIAAMAIGFLYGPGKRVWCRYLCPVSGVFGLLARLSPVHFAVDRKVWDSCATRPIAVNCAPLIDIKHMQSASQCHACGRCSGHRDAVRLAARSPNREIAGAFSENVSTPEGLLLVYGMLGIALAAFQWTASPLFVRMKQAVAEWLIAHDSFFLLQDSAPWWLLTHYPEAGDSFTWLDGASILGYILGIGLALGGLIHVCMLMGARFAKTPRFDWKSLALTLVPMAATSLFIGLTMLTVTLLRSEGIVFAWMPYARASLLSGGTLWSMWLAFRQVAATRNPIWRSCLTWLCVALPCAVIDAAWYLVFFVR